MKTRIYKILLAVLCLWTTFTIFYNAVKAVDYDQYPASGLYYKTKLLDYEPEEYWVLTEPDEYILEAIENPGRSVLVNVTESTFLKQKPHKVVNIRYEDNYYNVQLSDVEGVDYFLLPESQNILRILNTLRITVTPLCIGWIGFIMYRRTQKAT